MTCAFYFEFIASFECKTLTILTLKCTSHGYMYSAHYFGEIRIKLNVVTQIFDRFVGYVCLEISRCCSESILMKVSDIFIYIMKIM